MDPVIRTTPSVLQEVASNHLDVADAIDAARMQGPEIHSAVQTLGPIMHQVKGAAADLLAERDDALTHHANRHRAASNELIRAMHSYKAADDDNRAELENLKD
jgi:hypothetical protein